MAEENTYNSNYTGKQVDKVVSYSACASATGNNSIALGVCANASGCRSTTLGVCANASGNRSTALGYDAKSTDFGSTALGYIANASGCYSTALGDNTNASTCNATAVGHSANASGLNSTAVGYHANANSYDSTALGDHANAGNLNSTALGGDTRATGCHSTAVGHSANASGNRSTAVGYIANASNLYSTALGYYSNASGCRSTTLGVCANASGNRSTALGTDANASGNRSTALGYNAKSTGCYSTALGHNARANTNTACIAAGTAWRSFDSSGTSWSGSSDRNDKADISTITCGLDVLKQLRPVTFHWNQRAMYRNDGTHDETIKHSAQPYDKAAHKKGTKKAPSPSVGFLAQEVEKTLTQTFGDGQYAGIVGNSHRPPDNLSQEERDKFVAEVKEEQERGLEPELSLAPDNFIPWIVRAIQELDNRVTILEKEHNIVK